MSWDRIEMCHLTVRYGAQLAIVDLSGSFERGAVYVVMGRNGSGKTTLLRAIAGLLQVAPSQITPLLNSDDWRNGYGVATILPEDLGLYWTLKTRDVIRRTTYRRAQSRRAAHAAILKSLQRLEAVLGTDALDQPQQILSGGQRRIVTCAVALIGSPEVVVADEPFAGLDASRIGWVASSLSERASAGGLVILTHNGSSNALPAEWRRLELRHEVAARRHVLEPL